MQPDIHPAAMEAAARGAALLDERVPGWHDQIDLDRLDLSLGYQYRRGGSASSACILCQLNANGFGRSVQDAETHVTGSYSFGLNELFPNADLISFELAIQHGFTTTGRELASWEDLDKAWTQLITERREAATT